VLHKRAYTFYEVTPLGKEVLKLAEKLIALGTAKKKNK